MVKRKALRGPARPVTGTSSPRAQTAGCGEDDGRPTTSQRLPAPNSSVKKDFVRHSQSPSTSPVTGARCLRQLFVPPPVCAFASLPSSRLTPTIPTISDPGAVHWRFGEWGRGKRQETSQLLLQYDPQPTSALLLYYFADSTNGVLSSVYERCSIMGIHALPRPAIPVTTQSMLGFSRRSIISHTHSLQCPPIAPENQDGQPCALLASTFLRSGFQTALSRRQPASAPAHACRFKRCNIQNRDHQSRSQPRLDRYSSDDLSLVAFIRVRWRMLSSIRRAAPTIRIATSRKHQRLSLPSLPSDRAGGGLDSQLNCRPRLAVSNMPRAVWAA
ncbi:hypothetical protein IWX50DRAFT_27087 [Phyllosticta citricarpa]